MSLINWLQTPSQGTPMWKGCGCRFAMHQLLCLLVFSRQWGQWMIRQYNLYHKGACDWYIQSFVPIESWWAIKIYNSVKHFLQQRHSEKKFDWGNICSWFLFQQQINSYYKKETTDMETKMIETNAWVCLILATTLTQGIQGEMPCLDPTKYHVGLQVRVRPSNIRYEILDKSIGYHF